MPGSFPRDSRLLFIVRIILTLPFLDETDRFWVNGSEFDVKIMVIVVFLAPFLLMVRVFSRLRQEDGARLVSAARRWGERSVSAVDGLGRLVILHCLVRIDRSCPLLSIVTGILVIVSKEVLSVFGLDSPELPLQLGFDHLLVDLVGIQLIYFLRRFLFDTVGEAEERCDRLLAGPTNHWSTALLTGWLHAVLCSEDFVLNHMLILALRFFDCLAFGLFFGQLSSFSPVFD